MGLSPKDFSWLQRMDQVYHGGARRGFGHPVFEATDAGA